MPAPLSHASNCAAAAAPSLGARHLPASAIRVLVVDDDEGMRALMRRTLERLGVNQIYAAKDGVEALVLAKSQLPDVIIADYDMPVMHGLQLLKAVRLDPELAACGVIMLSGIANAEVVTRARDLGAASFMMKPFCRDDLQKQIDTVVHELSGARIVWARQA
jgi:two-component system chemotaxis response regulator CheY